MVLPSHFYPYWTVYDGLGKKYCDCSHKEYAIKTLELHKNEGFTYEQINQHKTLPPHIHILACITSLSLTIPHCLANSLFIIPQYSNTSNLFL